MKKRRLAIIMFMLIAVLTFGVGFAALTVDLDVNGSAELNLNPAFTDKIAFTTAVAGTDINGTGAGEGDTAGVNQNNGHKANFTVKSLKNAGDVATFTFVITNTSDYDAVVSLTTTTNTVNEGYFTINTDFGGNTKQLAKTDGTATVKVTVTLNTMPPATELTGSFSVVMRVSTTEVLETQA